MNSILFRSIPIKTIMCKCVSGDVAVYSDGRSPIHDKMFLGRFGCRRLSLSASKPKKHVPVRGKKLRSEKQLRYAFVDYKKVKVVGGDGGDGCVSFYSEPRKEFGGPSGGAGGGGGHVIFEASTMINSLERLPSVIRGNHGERGRSKNMDGRSGEHKIINVPIGTLVKDDTTILVDLSVDAEKYLVAKGGAGGKGNAFFLTNENRAPSFAIGGAPGQEFNLILELKKIADIGLVGYPNAGKSTLLRSISRATPAVAAYPFTTLNPHIGVVESEDYTQISVADIPGLIRGAHLNRGLGHSFLKHIERCSSHLYVIDLSEPQPWRQLEDLKYELEKYKDGMVDKPHAIIGNKIDLPESKINLEELRTQTDLPIVAISARYQQNIIELKSLLFSLHHHHKKKV